MFTLMTDWAKPRTGVRTKRNAVRIDLGVIAVGLIDAED
jgi:hypothetical protein